MLKRESITNIVQRRAPKYKNIRNASARNRRMIIKVKPGEIRPPRGAQRQRTGDTRNKLPRKQIFSHRMDQLNGNTQPPNRCGDLQETLQSLTVLEILAEMKGKVTLSRQERVRKELLIEKICLKAAPEELQKLRETAMRKQMQAGTCGRRGHKRKRTASDSGGVTHEPPRGPQEPV